MMAVGGLKAAAKRTAFGDVSNTTKDLAVARDVAAAVGKPLATQTYVKPSSYAQENVAPFLRPAQRPLNPAPKAQPAPLQENALKPAQQAQAIQHLNRVVTKTTTTIYKDFADGIQSSQPAAQTHGHVHVPTAPAHMSLAPRHYKSQPYLKPDPSTLPFAQGKSANAVAIEQVASALASDTIYEDAPEQPLAQSPKDTYESYMKLMDEKDNGVLHDIKEAQEVQEVQEVSKAIVPLVDAQRQLPALPEPEEYWEEEDEEIYDEQGYTTAHSYRSRGDNTTGGATTVLLPKVTNKVKKELAEAKEIVENARTPEEIDDEAWDTSMVAEYGEEIFAYMRELEVSSPQILFGP
jgi:G2/mitotic-specific cyclin 3/4